jgi:hypothetical protein
MESKTNQETHPINLLVIHSPITDYVCREIDRCSDNSILVGSRGYIPDGVSIHIDESIYTCIRLVDRLSKLMPGALVNLVVPHSGLHGWRFMIEHPVVSSYMYAEEGTASNTKKPGDVCLSRLSPQHDDNIKHFLDLGYTEDSLSRLFFSDTFYFDCSHPKYAGCVAAFDTAFVGMPGRKQVRAPSVIGRFTNTAVILFPYLSFFKSDSDLARWLSDCAAELHRRGVTDVVISPHPSNRGSLSFLMSIAITHLRSVNVSDIYDFRKTNKISSFIETGMIGFSLFISPIENSSTFYANTSNLFSTIVYI